MTNYNEKLKDFECVIKAQNGVLYVKGKPGIGKTAMFKKLAEKNGWNFIDIRLGQADETEVAGLPHVTKVDGVACYEYVPNRWVLEANKEPTLVMFDEMNRAPLAVRNAALQIINERECGQIKLTDNVFMCAVGNLGDIGEDGDGCEVEEFDPALNNRLVIDKYDLGLQDWKKHYANEHVISHVIDFLDNNGEYYYRKPQSDESESYPTPRSWTFLSDSIKQYTGKAKPDTGEYIGFVTRMGHCFIECLLVYSPIMID